MVGVFFKTDRKSVFLLMSMGYWINICARLLYPTSPTVRAQLTAKSNQIVTIDGYARVHNLSLSELMIQASLQNIC